MGEDQHHQHRTIGAENQSEVDHTRVDHTRVDHTRVDHALWHVLIVDDDDSILQITRLVLSKLTVRGRGIGLSFATSSELAKRVCQTRDFAVIVVDVVMETDRAGLDFVAWLRAQPFGKRPRVVIRTGQPGSIPERDVLASAEIDDYWSKTELSPKHLRRLMTSLLESLDA